MLNTRYKKLTGMHAGHSYTVTAPYSEVENPMRWMLHCETNADEKQIVAEMVAVQGKPTDIGGYYKPDDNKASAALRPSQTLNGILATL